MKVPGDRRCRECGTQWSYLETGSITCPSCDAVQSTSVSTERQGHHTSPDRVDLADVRSDLLDRPLRDVCKRIERRCRTYLTGRGYIEDGRLVPVDEMSLAVAELRYATGELGRRSAAATVESLDDASQRYLLELVQGVTEGTRPAPAAVPTDMHVARGLAVTSVVDAFRRDARRWLGETDRTVSETDRTTDGIDRTTDGTNRTTDGTDRTTGEIDQTTSAALLTALGDHVRRVEALDGEIAPRTANELVAAARDVAAVLVDGDEDAYVRATQRLEKLADRAE